MDETRSNPVGCILIDDPMSGERLLSGLSLPPRVRAFPCEWRAESEFMPALQTLLQRVRKEFCGAAILAFGAGCMAALALAEQLPVERLALVEPASCQRRMGVPARRVAGFAMRNLALCVSDALVTASPPARLAQRIARGIGVHGRSALLYSPGESGPELYINREKFANDAVTGFLLDGVFPKELAQNPEMCIIYG